MNFVNYEGEWLDIFDVIPGSPSPEEELIRDDAEQRLFDELGKALMKLNPRQQHIIMWRFGFLGPTKTLKELSHELCISIERVHQIEKQAIAILNTHMEQYREEYIIHEGGQ